MNAKKCKVLRRLLRADGVDPRERSYERTVFATDLSSQVSLDPLCGRAVYQRMKREMK